MGRAEMDLQTASGHRQIPPVSAEDSRGPSALNRFVSRLMGEGRLPRIAVRHPFVEHDRLWPRQLVDVSSFAQPGLASWQGSGFDLEAKSGGGVSAFLSERQSPCEGGRLAGMWTAVLVDQHSSLGVTGSFDVVFRLRATGPSPSETA